MSDLYEAFKQYKEPKKPAVCRIDQHPVKFRMLGNSKPKQQFFEHKEKYYVKWQIQVRDMSDGKFKMMVLGNLAFKRLGMEINRILDNGENPLNFNFVIRRNGEGLYTRYDIYSVKAK